MKALILSGGTGSRFNSSTKSFPKQLLPVMGKPVLFYGIESIVRAGIKEIYIVIWKNGNKIIDSVGTGKKWGVKIKYIKQKPLGLAHAVKAAKKFLNNSHFLMWLGDTIIREDFNDIITFYNREKPNALILLGKTKNPKRCGVAEVKNNRIIKVVEKPENPPSNLALAGLYLFDSSIMKAVESIKPSHRGEIEITDAIQYLIDHSCNVMPFLTKRLWIDVGCPESFLLANILLMKNLENSRSIKRTEAFKKNESKGSFS